MKVTQSTSYNVMIFYHVLQSANLILRKEKKYEV